MFFYKIAVGRVQTTLRIKHIDIFYSYNGVKGSALNLTRMVDKELLTMSTIPLKDEIFYPMEHTFGFRAIV